MRKHTVCCSLPKSTSNPYSRGLPSKRYQIHQQRAPDLCGPTFQLITRYTPILDSRSQTSAPKWPRLGPHMYTHVPDAGKLLIHRLHIVGANRYKGTHSNAGMAAYRGGVVTSGVGIYTSAYFRHHMFGKTGTTVGYGNVPGGWFHWRCGYCHHTFMCHQTWRPISFFELVPNTCPSLFFVPASRVGTVNDVRASRHSESEKIAGCWECTAYGFWPLIASKPWLGSSLPERSGLDNITNQPWSNASSPQFLCF